MSLWQCKIITPTGEREEIIDGKESLLKYVDRDLLDKGEVGIIIQRQIPNGKTRKPISKKQKKTKPWWKFW